MVEKFEEIGEIRDKICYYRRKDERGHRIWPSEVCNGKVVEYKSHFNSSTVFVCEKHALELMDCRRILLGSIKKYSEVA